MRQPCLMIPSVSLLIPFQFFAMASKISGLSLEISFKLLATLLLTVSDTSFFSKSKIGKIGLGSFFRKGIAIAHGSRGRIPSLAKRRTCAFGLCAQCSITLIICSLYLIIKGRTANSQVMNCVIISSDRTAVSK
ncbi:hypothetical protein D3C71_726690 [compost metagenome]